MIARIARQYLRFIFASLIFSAHVAIGTIFGHVEVPPVLLHPVIGPLSWVILLILVIGLPIMLVTLVLPGFLPLIELWLVTLLLSALISPLAANTNTPGWVNGLILMGLFIVVERMMYGPWLSRLWRRDMAPKTADLTLPGTPEDIWPRLCPTPGRVDLFYWPGATILPTPEGTAGDFVLSLPRRGTAKDDLVAITIEDQTYPTHLRYRTTPMSGSPTPGATIEICLTNLDDTRSNIGFTQTFHNVSFGQRLFFYLGHNFRDTVASIRARLCGRRDWSLVGAQMVKRP